MKKVKLLPVIILVCLLAQGLAPALAAARNPDCGQSAAMQENSGGDQIAPAMAHSCCCAGAAGHIGWIEAGASSVPDCDCVEKTSEAPLNPEAVLQNQTRTERFRVAVCLPQGLAGSVLSNTGFRFSETILQTVTFAHTPPIYLKNRSFLI